MKVRTLSILELYEHIEIVEYMLLAAPVEYELRLYILPEVRTQLDASLLEKCTVNSHPNKIVLVNQLCLEADEYTRTIVLTRNIDYRIFSPVFNLALKPILFVHDSRFGFASSAILDYSWRSRLRRLKWKFQGAWPRSLLSEEKDWAGFVVSTSKAADFLSRNGEERPVLSIPFAVWPEQYEALVSGKRHPLKVVVPGSVDPLHRDYELIADSFRMYAGAPLELSIPGIIRGKGGEEALRIISESLPAQVKFSGSSRQNVLYYQNELRDADFLLLPIRRVVKYATQFEFAGVTKGIGAIEDQIRYGKRALISSDVPSWSDLSSWQIRFGNALDLQNALESLAEFEAMSTAPAAFRQNEVRLKWSAFLLSLNE